MVRDWRASFVSESGEQHARVWRAHITPCGFCLALRSRRCRMPVLPRFLLAGLLIFSGTGFLVENLWDARKVFGRYEFASIWAVFIINIIAGELLPQFGLLMAIGAGFLLCFIGFTYRFAQTSTIADPISGYDYSSTAVPHATLHAVASLPLTACARRVALVARQPHHLRASRTTCAPVAPPAWHRTTPPHPLRGPDWLT
jgi:hypothetical protein